MTIASVKDYHTKQFIELFLSKLFNTISMGEFFEIPSLGYFRIKNLKKSEFSSPKETTTVILYSDSTASSASKIGFSLPSRELKSVSPVDNYFSISFGKPIIGKGSYSSEELELISSTEQRRYLEMKADVLIATGRKFNTAASFSSDELNSSVFGDGESSVNKQGASSGDESDNENVPWNFGGNWVREFEAEKILSEDTLLNESDLIKIDSFQNEPSDLSWDFVETDKIKITNIDLPDKKLSAMEDIENSTPEDSFVEVKSKTKELKLDLSELYKVTEASENDFDDELTPEQEAFLKKFDRVKKAVVDENENDVAAYSLKDIYEKKEVIPEEKKVIVEEPIDEEELQLSVEKMKEQKTSKKSHKSSKKYSKVFGSVGILFSLLLIGLFAYYRFYGIPNSVAVFAGLEEKTFAKKSNPTIIERDFLIPVNFPYQARIDTAALGMNNNIDTSTVATTESSTQANETRNYSPHSELDASDIFSKRNPMNQIGRGASSEQQRAPEVKSEPIKIEQKKTDDVKESRTQEREVSLLPDQLEGDDTKGYSIQISSWQSKNLAEREVQKFKNRGYAAFIIPVRIPQKGGMWYRVRVGGFKSVDEAKDFLKKNK